MKAAIKSYEEERDTRISVESARIALSGDLERVNQELQRLNDQVPNSCIWIWNISIWWTYNQLIVSMSVKDCPREQ